MSALSANKIKFIRSLHQKKYRDEHNLFIAEGEKIVEEAMRSGYNVKEVYHESEIGKEAMQRISNLSSPSPVLAVIEKPNLTPDSILQSVSNKENLSGRKPLYLALDGVKDPGNLGTIIRVADWFGVEAIFASHGSVEVYNPKVVQATMGAIFRKQVIYTDLAQVCNKFRAAGLPVYGTFLDGMNMYRKELSIGTDAPVMIVIGNESEGISAAMEALVSDRLYIPPYPADDPGSESLNAAVATAITVAEFRRR